MDNIYLNKIKKDLIQLYEHIREKIKNKEKTAKKIGDKIDIINICLKQIDRDIEDKDINSEIKKFATTIVFEYIKLKKVLEFEETRKINYNLTRIEDNIKEINIILSKLKDK